MLDSPERAYNNIRGDIMPRIFNVTIRPCTDTAGYWAKCDMPDGGCTTQGETLQETQKNMLEAMDFYLEDYPEIVEYFLNFEVDNAQNTSH